ncbi:MAG: nuclear transport factor 2 family protein [Dehalococcoidia bacterium]|nr:nuclear transport factor 2 family protein [Dehalococcoidia bacterium]
MALSTEDKLAIQDLYARYNHAIDFGKGDVWAATFTPDGTFSSLGAGTFTGTEQLTGFGNGFATRIKGRHWTNNLVIEDAGDGAKGTCYLALLLLGGPEKGTSFLTTGIYNDELVRTDGGWRFKSRAVTPDA